MLFRDTPVEQLEPNLLVIHIQPDEGISLRFEAKVPGPGAALGAVKMDFEYDDYFGARPSTGYETAALRLHDRRLDAVPARRHGGGGVGVVQPILDVWKALPPRELPQLRRRHLGTEGGRRAAPRDGRHWESSVT